MKTFVGITETSRSKMEYVFTEEGKITLQIKTDKETKKEVGSTIIGKTLKVIKNEKEEIEVYVNYNGTEKKLENVREL